MSQATAKQLMLAPERSAHGFSGESWGGHASRERLPQAGLRGSHRRWDNNMLEDLIPFCRQTFPGIEHDLGSRAEQFCERMASIALQGVIDPMGSGQLPEFVRNADLKARRRWASAVASILHHFPAGKRGAVWARWMKSYWEFRLEAGSPSDPTEVAVMVRWTMEMEEAFPEARQIRRQWARSTNR